MEKFPENIIYELKMQMNTESIGEIRKQLAVIISAREDAIRLKLEKKEPKTRSQPILQKLYMYYNGHIIVNIQMDPECTRKRVINLIETIYPHFPQPPLVYHRTDSFRQRYRTNNAVEGWMPQT